MSKKKSAASTGHSPSKSIKLLTRAWQPRESPNTSCTSCVDRKRRCTWLYEEEACDACKRSGQSETCFEQRKHLLDFKAKRRSLDPNKLEHQGTSSKLKVMGAHRTPLLLTELAKETCVSSDRDIIPDKRSTDDSFDVESILDGRRLVLLRAILELPC